MFVFDVSHQRFEFSACGSYTSFNIVIPKYFYICDVIINGIVFKFWFMSLASIILFFFFTELVTCNLATSRKLGHWQSLCYVFFLFSGIIVQCCLMLNMWKPLFYIFFLFSFFISNRRVNLVIVIPLWPEAKQPIRFLVPWSLMWLDSVGSLSIWLNL